MPTQDEDIARHLREALAAHSKGAPICAFSELAVTGLHRQIAREAKPEVVAPAIRELQDHGARQEARRGPSEGCTACAALP